MDFSHLNRPVLIAALVPILLGLMAWVSRGRANAKDGWQYLRPSIGLVALTAGAVPLLALGLYLVPGLTTALQDPSFWSSRDNLVLIAGDPFLILGTAFVIAKTLFFRVRFNADGVEPSWFFRAKFYHWSDITRLDRSVFLGPRLVLRSGKSVPVSMYYRGFTSLAGAAIEHGVPVAEEFEVIAVRP